MKVWKYVLKETENNPLDEDFERGFVKADTFDEAKAKVDHRMNTTWKKTPLELVALTFELEVNLE